jgi:thioesterase domain-containing protein
MDAAEAFLQGVLHAEIPLTRAIGLRVAAYTGDTLTLAAPLEPNTNHKSTAFGGSLYSVAVLSGWGLLYLRLRDLAISAHVVIHETQVRYLRPVTGELVATARLAPGESLERAVKLFRRRGRARIGLDVQITQEGAAAVAFHGAYVIHG